MEKNPDFLEWNSFVRSRISQCQGEKIGFAIDFSGSEFFYLNWIWNFPDIFQIWDFPRIFFYNLRFCTDYKVCEFFVIFLQNLVAFDGQNHSQTPLNQLMPSTALSRFQIPQESNIEEEVWNCHEIKTKINYNFFRQNT